MQVYFTPMTLVELDIGENVHVAGSYWYKRFW